MGNKKDIGKLFETKLSAGNKIPKESLWEKINTSLDEEKRKRKRLLIYWWLGGGISVLLGLVLLFGAGNFLNQNSQIPLENNSSEQNSFSNFETENTDTIVNISKEDSFLIKNNGEEKLPKIEDLNESVLNNSEEPIKMSSKKKIQKGSSKGKSIDEIYTVSEKYYYYNSKDGKQIITNKKQEIDSLVSQHYKSLDSTTTKKMETPEK